MNRQIQDRFDFQISAMSTIKTEVPASPRFVDRSPVLSQAEMVEGDKAHASGMSGEEFGRLIAERDMSRPIDLPKPLSEEHKRIIELLRDHYDHTDRPVLLFEGEHYVTLRIPRVPRPSYVEGE